MNQGIHRLSFIFATILILSGGAVFAQDAEESENEANTGDEEMPGWIQSRFDCV